MTEPKARKPNGSLWGNLDESARIAREQAENQRIAREAKTRRLRQMRLAKQLHDVDKTPVDTTTP